MIRSINLTEDQAKAAQEGTLKELRHPWGSPGNLGFTKAMSPGNVIVGKERWALFKGSVFYEAEGYNNSRINKVCGFKSANLMRREYARFKWKIVDMRVGYLHEMTDQDVRDCGIPASKIDIWRQWLDPRDIHCHAFGIEWDKRWGKKYPFRSNPSCWVLRIEKCDTDTVLLKCPGCGSCMLHWVGTDLVECHICGEMRHPEKCEPYPDVYSGNYD